jgi:hypothetical protein
MGNEAGKQSNSPSQGSASGATATKPTGQKVSRERGTATNHKKNPGKRAHQGGSSR